MSNYHYFVTDTGTEEPPSSLLWSIVLLAQHNDIVGQSLKSLDLIDEAIEHTPTDVQLYMVKARILKVGSMCHALVTSNNTDKYQLVVCPLKELISL